MTQLLLCPSIGPKCFWICPNCLGLDPKKQLFTTDFCNLTYVLNVLDQPKFFGLVQKYFGTVERHIISLYNFNP